MAPPKRPHVPESGTSARRVMAGTPTELGQLASNGGSSSNLGRRIDHVLIRPSRASLANGSVSVLGVILGGELMREALETD